MSERYRASTDKLEECYDAAVYDTQLPEHLQVIAVCPGPDEAELIAQALNAQVADRKRLEVGPAVVYRDANQNAPSVKDGGKAKGLA